MPLKRYAAIIFLTAGFFSVQNAQAQPEEITWSNSVAEARQKHPDLTAAREKINQSKADKTITASALLPQISASSSGDVSKTKSSSSRVDSYAYAVNGKQLVFDGFKTYFDVEQAAKKIESAKYNYEVVSSNVRLNLKTAFIDLLKAQLALSLTEKIAERRQKSKKLIQLSYNAGREHRGSLLTAEANLAQAEFEVRQAKRDIDLSQRQLARQLGRTHLTPLAAKGELAAEFKDRQKPDFEEMAENNPFLRELVIEKEAAKWGVKSSEANFFPQVYATGATGKTGSGWPPDRKEWSAGVSLTVPLFEGGSNIAGASKAKAALNQTQAEEKSGRDSVILTLENTWTALQDAIEQVDVKKKFLEAGQEREKIAQAEYSTGLISFNDWIIIEDNLVNSEKSFLDAQANALLAEAAWAQAKGDTLDDEK